MRNDKIDNYFQKAEYQKQPMSIKFAKIKSIRTRKAVKDLRKKQKEHGKIV